MLRHRTQHMVVRPSTPPSLRFVRYHERSAPPGSMEDLSSTLPGNWAGPIALGNGYEPRLAQGAGGLFLLSADSTSQGSTPSAIRIRRYDPAQLTFAAPVNLQTFPQSQLGLFDGGALGANGGTGEVVAAWPHEVATGGSLMRLYLSTNGGVSFSPGEEVARIVRGYAINDNARLAVAANGTGFLTFRDAGGARGLGPQSSGPAVQRALRQRLQRDRAGALPGPARSLQRARLDHARRTPRLRERVPRGHRRAARRRQLHGPSRRGEEAEGAPVGGDSPRAARPPRKGQGNPLVDAARQWLVAHDHGIRNAARLSAARARRAQIPALRGGQRASWALPRAAARRVAIIEHTSSASFSAACGI